MGLHECFTSLHASSRPPAVRIDPVCDFGAVVVPLLHEDDLSHCVQICKSATLSSTSSAFVACVALWVRCHHLLASVTVAPHHVATLKGDCWHTIDVLFRGLGWIEAQTLRVITHHRAWCRAQLDSGCRILCRAPHQQVHALLNTSHAS